MKSNSIDRPPVIQDLGNGAFYYNYAVTTRTDTDPDGNERTSFDYRSVKIWGLPVRAAIVKAVIRDELDETAEFDLVNSYNAAQEGLLDDDEAAEAVAAYKAYILRLRQIKAFVKADLETAGYDENPERPPS